MQGLINQAQGISAILHSKIVVPQFVQRRLKTAFLSPSHRSFAVQIENDGLPLLRL